MRTKDGSLTGLTLEAWSEQFRKRAAEAARKLAQPPNDFNTFKTVAEMEKFQGGSWSFLTRVLTQLYEAWDKIEALTRKLEIGLATSDALRRANVSMRTELNTRKFSASDSLREGNNILRRDNTILQERLKDDGDLRLREQAARNEADTLRQDNKSLRGVVAVKNETIDQLVDKGTAQADSVAYWKGLLNVAKGNIGYRDQRINDLERQNKLSRILKDAMARMEEINVEDEPTPSMQAWLDEVSRLLSKELEHLAHKVTVNPGPKPPYVATAEQYILQGRSCAKTARLIGAQLGTFEGFKWNDERAAYNYLVAPPLSYRTPFFSAPAYDSSVWLKKIPPKTTGETQRAYGPASARKWQGGPPVDSAPGGYDWIGGMGFFGTETTTVKIMDDTLSAALGTLLERGGSKVAGGSGVAAKVASGRDAEISAAVTILSGGRIRLKLKVGRAVHELRTFLTAGD